MVDALNEAAGNLGQVVARRLKQQRLMKKYGYSGREGAA
jgi:hypothetical protein